MKKIIFLALVFSATSSFAWVIPDGGLDGSDFDSNQFKGKSFVLFYVNPKYKDLNNEASDTLKAQKFDNNKFGSLAIIDLKSTWIPNALVISKIKKKAKKYPRTIYLKDRKRHIQKILDFKPQGNDIFAFDKEGKLIFKHLGKLNTEKINEMIEVLKKSLD
jgi:predicted transcriptional regulator